MYIDMAREVGFTAGPEHFGYSARAFVADTDEKAQEIGRNFMWTLSHRMRGPREHSDPPGFQSRAATALAQRRPGAAQGKPLTYEELQEINTVVVGTPEIVTRKLKTLVEALNPGYLILTGIDGPIPHKDMMRSLELLGKEVVPALHEVKLHAYA